MMREIWTYLCAHHWHKIELPNCIIISFDVAIPDLSSREHLVRSKVPLPRRWCTHENNSWVSLFFFFLPLSLSVLIRGNSGSDVCRQLQDVSQHLFNYFIRPRFSGGIRGFTEDDLIDEAQTPNHCSNRVIIRRIITAATSKVKRKLLVAAGNYDGNWLNVAQLHKTSFAHKESFVCHSIKRAIDLKKK